MQPANTFLLSESKLNEEETYLFALTEIVEDLVELFDITD